ncbi:MAG: TrkA family potassium uptake protein [Faecalibacterium sp.]|jgi:trk system potassium uptake protein TrkA|nr:TrkA family potassium uptake protein [Faecalibacterium sp.]
MIIQHKQPEKHYIIIIGCGRLGAGLANAAATKDQDVLILDSAEEAFRKLDSSYGGLTMTGDATDPDVLREAQMDQADAVIVVTNNDSVNITAAQMAKKLFGAAHVIARLYDPDCACVYEEFGIETICPAQLSEAQISQMLQKGGSVA